MDGMEGFHDHDHDLDNYINFLLISFALPCSPHPTLTAKPGLPGLASPRPHVTGLRSLWQYWSEQQT